MCRWVFARIVARSGLVGIGSEYIKKWRDGSCKMKHPRICQSSFGNFSSEPSSQPQKPIGLKSTLGTHLPSPPSLPSLPPPIITKCGGTGAVGGPPFRFARTGSADSVCWLRRPRLARNGGSLRRPASAGTAAHDACTLCTFRSSVMLFFIFCSSITTCTYSEPQKSANPRAS